MNRQITFILLYLIGINSFWSYAQNQPPVAWLQDYTDEVNTGSDIYRHAFTHPDGDECILNIKIEKTDKRGKISTNAFMFFLSDVDANTVSFKPKGKQITVTFYTKGQRDFIKEFEDDEFKGYVNEVELYTVEVEKARAMVDAFKSNLSKCKEEALTWASPDEAQSWLSENVTSATHKDSEYKQNFGKGDKPYLVRFSREYTDSKGVVSEAYTFNITDIDHLNTVLNISGKDLVIEIPLKNKDKFVEFNENKILQNYQNELEIYVNYLSTARNIIGALEYLAQNTKVERQSWSDVNACLTYISSNLTIVKDGDDTYKQSLKVDNSPAGLVSFIVEKTDSKGRSSSTSSSFYLNDLLKDAQLSISGSRVSFILQTKDKDKFIRILADNELKPWDDEVQVLAADIESARELMHAFQYAVENSDIGLIEPGEMSAAVKWLKDNTPDLKRGSRYQQTLQIHPDQDYKLTLVRSEKGDNSETIESFEIYPEDLIAEELKVDIRGSDLYLNLSTGKNKFVRYLKNEEVQNYTSDFRIYFDDIKQAKNFKRNLEYLKENFKPKTREFSALVDAKVRLSGVSKDISIGTDLYNQKVSFSDDANCQMKLTLVEKDSKGGATEIVYDFLLSDIQAESVGISVSGKKCTVSFQTKGEQKLIKPYKNSEPQNFSSEAELLVDNLMEAKMITSALKSAVGFCGQ